ncbi:MAG: carbohydrate-binding domain-containing protein, partial [Bacteroidales bacterium]|nr:carbohydrate-binding domain-containing protein [Bacteroidales bacterium]
MKKIIILLFATILAIGTISAQERVVFYSGSIPVHSQNIDYVDSVNFVNGITIVHNNIGETNFQFPVVGIDSIVFAEEETQVDTGEIIYITYAGNSVSVINPWANRGVTVTTIGADVTVNAVSGQQDIIYYLSGTTTDGSLTISSDHRFNMTLDGVSITNPTGAAIKSLLDEKINLTLKNTSTLADGATSTDKAPFDSRGQIIISGNGT